MNVRPATESSGIDRTFEGTMASAFDELHLHFESRPKPSGIALLGNVGFLPDGPTRLDERCELRPATQAEGNALGRLVMHYGGVGDRPRRNPFETRIVSTPQPDGSDWITWPSLPSNEFRYHVLDYTEFSVWPRHIMKASVLTAHELIEVFHVGTFSGGFGGGASRELVSFMSDVETHDSPFLSLSSEYLHDLAAVQQKLQKHEDRVLPLHETLEEYLELQHVKHPRLAFLGFFTILEKLLTHQPRGSERYDTITHQVATKINLLNRRFAKPLDYSCFKQAEARMVWQKLYGLRSAVAHGRKLDFANDLQILVSFTTAYAFVRAALRAVMRRALREPQLVADLREC